MEATAKKLFTLSSDFEIQEEARRRKAYYSYVGKLEKEIQEKDAAITEQATRIAELEAQLSKIKK